VRLGGLQGCVPGLVFCHCDKTPDISNLRKEGFILAHAKRFQSHGQLPPLFVAEHHVKQLEEEEAETRKQRQKTFGDQV
jgi:hypothetical protein